MSKLYSYYVCNGSGVPGLLRLSRPKTEYYVIRQTVEDSGLILGVGVVAGPFDTKEEARQEADRRRGSRNRVMQR